MTISVHHILQTLYQDEIGKYLFTVTPIRIEHNLSTIIVQYHIISLSGLAFEIFRHVSASNISCFRVFFFIISHLKITIT